MSLPCLPLLPTQPISSRRKTPLSLKIFSSHGNRSWHHQNFLPSCTFPPPTTFNTFFQKWVEKTPKTTVLTQCSPLFPLEPLKPTEVIWVEESWCPCVHRQPGLQIQLANAPGPNCSLATGDCRFPDTSSRLCSSPAVLVGVPLFVVRSCLSSCFPKWWVHLESLIQRAAS